MSRTTSGDAALHSARSAEHESREFQDMPLYSDGYFISTEGIFRPAAGVVHRDDQYDSACFEQLLDMQSRHFWYRGRFRFLFRALEIQLRRNRWNERKLDVVDLGGGCGGWIRYLQDHWTGAGANLSLADSSTSALEMSSRVMREGVSRYQVDLLRLGWKERWDVAFLLDVAEHIPNDGAMFREVWTSLRPGGLLFVTVPALQRFWTYNDDIAHHIRRYSRTDMNTLAVNVGFQPIFSRYFMFLLSPLLLLSRRGRIDISKMSQSEIKELERRTQGVPSEPLNQLLYWTFAMEASLGFRVPFPWGTSLLAVLQRP